ncbi:DUF4347 domain-containing protein [Acaryochloris sp. CCMEE 5410]|uniref:DUF4347 domain-containing protein n=1 Tax=Acaryochloris sp. CCMEE 5410 TaxID=310037 RepID=UPI001F221FAE|nr:DUF4347 domain-containing protein [Acaryochloris sp. CCMEE 5410]
MPHTALPPNVLPGLTVASMQSSDPSSIVIIDAAVDQYRYLLMSPLDGMAVHILNGQEDGIAQIVSLLKQHQRLSRLFLFCQGASSQLILGKTALSDTNLWMYADTIREWRHYFAQDAEILIHGCNLNTNRMGQALISWLGLLARVCVQVV